MIRTSLIFSVMVVVSGSGKDESRCGSRIEVWRKNLKGNAKSTWLNPFCLLYYQLPLAPRQGFFNLKS